MLRRTSVLKLAGSELVLFFGRYGHGLLAVFSAGFSILMARSQQSVAVVAS